MQYKMKMINNNEEIVLSNQPNVWHNGSPAVYKTSSSLIPMTCLHIIDARMNLECFMMAALGNPVVPDV